MVRTTLNGDAVVRPVQMYGAIGGEYQEHNMQPRELREGTTIGSRGDLNQEHSEDDHSVRTMIVGCLSIIN